MQKYTLQNLDCAECALKIERALKRLDSVDAVTVNFATESMHIETDRMDEVVETIRSLEPEVEVVDTETAEIRGTGHRREQLRDLIFIGLSLILFAAGMLFRARLRATPLSYAEYAVFLTVYLLSGWNVLKSAAQKTIRGNLFDEHFLMSIATIGAIAIGALAEAAGVMIFFKVGEFLENLAVTRSRRSIKSLLEIRPDTAHVRRGSTYATVDPRSVRVGETILVKPGERVPLDGAVISGKSFVDTAALTGEPVPRSAKKGDTVLSGMIVTTGSLHIRVEKSYANSSASKILDLVEHALASKAETEKFITTFARFYTPAVMIVALFIALLPPLIIDASFRVWIYRALVILVISCPCALVISVPLSYFGGIGSASRKGILIKGSSYLDALSAVRTVVFDKTGTLTKGIFEVLEIHPANGFSEGELLEYAALAESHSNHPIGRAIRTAYGREIDTGAATDVHEVSGQGIRATVLDKPVMVGNDRMLHREGIDHEVCDVKQTVAYVVIGGRYAGYITIGDEEKDEARSSIEELKHLGVKRTVMLTGDNGHVAEHVAERLGIDSYYAELLPDDKIAVLERMLAEQEGHDKVAFVGDGLNDAPVIARADVGIAMGRQGSDASIDVADVVLMTDALKKLPLSLRLSRKTRGIVFQNIVLALTVKLVFVALGSLGLAGMWEAVFADMGVALAAIFNALRVLRIK
jgi:Cd2+/Zn2+-exporting ATPase